MLHPMWEKQVPPNNQNKETLKFFTRKNDKEFVPAEIGTEVPQISRELTYQWANSPPTGVLDFKRMQAQHKICLLHSKCKFSHQAQIYAQC